MRSLLARTNPRVMNAVLGTVFIAALVQAMFPPLYLLSSGVRTPVLGIPFAVTYWVLNGAVPALVLWLHYAADVARGAFGAAPAVTATADAAPVVPAPVLEEVAR